MFNFSYSITHYPLPTSSVLHHDILMVATYAQASCHNGGWRFSYLLRVSLAA